MPAPSSATYSAAALVAAHTSFKDLIDAGSAAGYVTIRDSADVLLAQIPLSDPCGTVNGMICISPRSMTSPSRAVRRSSPKSGAPQPS